MNVEKQMWEKFSTLMDEIIESGEQVQLTTITLTPDQYSIVDEPKMLPEICEKLRDKP